MLQFIAKTFLKIGIDDKIFETPSVSTQASTHLYPILKKDLKETFATAFGG